MTKTGNTSSSKKILPIIEEQGRALMQAVPDLVFLLGTDGSYIDIFSAADEDLYLPKEELVGKNVLETLPPPVGQDCMAAIGRLKSERDVSEFSYELPINGSPRWFEGRVALCGPDTVLVLVRDFTRQRLAEHNLKEANTALQKRARQLQQLEQELTRAEQRERRRMAQLIHDNLQQLLVGAKLNLSVLTEQVGDKASRESIRVVTEVIDEAIDQSRLLTASLSHPILYEGSLDQSLNWIKNHTARLYGLNTTIVIEGDHNPILNESIRFTMFKSIQELLLNVVKHAGVNAATVKASVQNSHNITITVSDEGAGFSLPELESVDGHMDRFGLFTLKERVSWLNGSIDIDTSPGNGCRTTVTLPVETTMEESERVDADPALSSPDSSHHYQSYAVRGQGPIKVLLADDHALLRQGLIRILLQEPLFSVVGEASSGEVAIELVNKLKPDVVLMDVMMPGIGGAEATRLIKQTHPDVEILALSMYQEHERGEEMRAAGASAYITKTQAASSVCDAIRNSYRKRQRRVE